jgi:exosortase C (VPDSG-CTERM-specific)
MRRRRMMFERFSRRAQIEGADVSPMRKLTTRGRLIGLAAFGSCLLLVFLRPLAALVVLAAGSELNSHILLIPFISAYLICLQRNHLPKLYVFAPGWILSFLLLGLLSAALAWSLNPTRGTLSQNDYLALMTFSFLCLLVAGGFLFLGRTWMAKVAFPIVFLIFMIPMPEAMADNLEMMSQRGSTEAASLFFSISGTPVLREGNVFQLPGMIIRVAQECSGIRSSWVLFVTSILASHLFLKSSWRRALLVAFVIPLGILRNGFRILVIGLLCVHVGPEMIHSVIHRRGGPFFFALSLIPLFLVLWWLRRTDVVDPRMGAGPAESPLVTVKPGEPR